MQTYGAEHKVNRENNKNRINEIKATIRRIPKWIYKRIKKKNNENIRVHLNESYIHNDRIAVSLLRPYIYLFIYGARHSEMKHLSCLISSRIPCNYCLFFFLLFFYYYYLYYSVNIVVHSLRCMQRIIRSTKETINLWIYIMLTRVWYMVKR